jgi:iron complex transport system substrate-binding protein
MVALCAHAQTLSHLRSVGGGIFALRPAAHSTHLAGFLLALAACGSGARAPANRGPITLPDDAGRAVVLAAPARRIVSLSPSFTEILFALGAGDRVVGRTTWCDYPAAALALPSVGDGLNPNVEAVAARQPDLVVLYRSALDETAAAQLGRLGIPSLVLRQDHLADVAHAARLLGRALGDSARADSLAAVIDTFLAASPPRAATRLAFVVWDNPPIVIGAGSYLDELARLAGGSNVFHDLASASAEVSLETLAARDPDVIVVLADSTTAPGFAARREWQTIRAVRERRFVYLVGSLFGRPNPRMREAVAEFRRRLAAAR